MNKEELIDKIVKEWSYRCKKGYPDLNDPKDLQLFKEAFGVEIFEKILGEKVLKESTALNTKRAIDRLVRDYGSEFQFKKLSDKRRLSSPIKGDPEFFIDLLKTAFEVDQVEVLEPNEKNNPSSSFRMYKATTEEFGPIEIILSTNFPGGAGIQNERIFYNNIKQYLEEYKKINVEIKDSRKTLRFNNITDIQDTSKIDAKERAKSDMRLLTGGKVIANISLKKDGGFRWGSVFTLFPDFVQKFLDKGIDSKDDFPIRLLPDERKEGKYQMYDRKTGERVTKVVVVDTPEGLDEIIIFGNEDPKPIIVGKTFSEKDFTFSPETNTATVQVSEIFQTLKEIEQENLDPVFIVTQHINKPKGIDFRMFPKKYGGQPGERARFKEISYKQVVS